MQTIGRIAKYWGKKKNTNTTEIKMKKALVYYNLDDLRHRTFVELMCSHFFHRYIHKGGVVGIVAFLFGCKKN